MTTNTPITTDLLIEQVQLLQLKPGDILVFKCRHISSDGAKHLQGRLDQYGVKALFIDSNTELTVVRPAATESSN